MKPPMRKIHVIVGPSIYIRKVNSENSIVNTNNGAKKLEK